MKILYVINSLKIGGAEKFIISLTNFLYDQKKENVHLLNLNYENFTDNNELEINSTLPKANYHKIKQPQFLKYVTGNKITKKIFSKLFFRYYEKYITGKALTEIKRINPTVIISSLIYSDRIIMKCDLSVPVIIIDHGDYREKFSDRKELIEKAAAVVCCAEANKKIMQEYNSKENMVVIHDGLLKPIPSISQTRKSLGIPEDTFVYIMIARGIREKGWIEALKGLRGSKYSSNSFLVLVGDGPGIEEAKVYAKEKKINNVLFTGFMTNPGEIIHLADAALLPSYFISESLPLTLIEALCADIPVIASNVGGISEIVTHHDGDCGILVPLQNGKTDVKILASSMDLLYENYKKYKMNIAHCRVKFDMAFCAEQYLTLSRTFLKTKPLEKKEYRMGNILQ